MCLLLKAKKTKENLEDKQTHIWLWNQSHLCKHLISIWLSLQKKIVENKSIIKNIIYIITQLHKQNN
jgi:hypothetical protein